MRRLKAYLLWRRIDKHGDLLRINLVEVCNKGLYVLACRQAEWYFQTYAFRTKNIVGNFYEYKTARSLYDKFENHLVIYVSAQVKLDVYMQQDRLVVLYIDETAPFHVRTLSFLK